MATGPHQDMSTDYSKLRVSTIPRYPPFIITAAVFLVTGPTHSFMLPTWHLGEGPQE